MKYLLQVLSASNKPKNSEISLKSLISSKTEKMYRKSRKRCHYVSSLHLPQNFPLPSFVAFPPLQFCISSTCKSIFPLLVACSFRKESVEDATQKLRQLFGDHTQNFIIACHVQCFPKNMYNIQILKYSTKMEKPAFLEVRF